MRLHARNDLKIRHFYPNYPFHGFCLTLSRQKSGARKSFGQLSVAGASVCGLKNGFLIKTA